MTQLTRLWVAKLFGLDMIFFSTWSWVKHQFARVQSGHSLFTLTILSKKFHAFKKCLIRKWKKTKRSFVCLPLFLLCFFFIDCIYLCVFVSYPPFVKKRHDNLSSVKFNTGVLGASAIYDTFRNDFIVVK